MGAALDAAIDEVIETMTNEQRADPRFYPDNREAWTAFFRRRYECELAAYDGPPPHPARNNAAGRRRWWSAPSRTLEFVLDTSPTYLQFLMLHACFYTICLLFRYTSWHVYAFSGTNLLTSCHSASSLFSAIFVFQK
jgi:hypothetical protein